MGEGIAQGMIASRWRLLEAVLEVCLSQQGLGWSPGRAWLRQEGKEGRMSAAPLQLS